MTQLRLGDAVQTYAHGEGLLYTEVIQDSITLAAVFCRIFLSFKYLEKSKQNGLLGFNFLLTFMLSFWVG